MTSGITVMKWSGFVLSMIGSAITDKDIFLGCAVTIVFVGYMLELLKEELKNDT